MKTKFKIGDLVKLFPSGGRGHFTIHGDPKTSTCDSPLNEVKTNDIGLIVNIITIGDHLPSYGYFYVILHKETLLEINDEYVGEL